MFHLITGAIGVYLVWRFVLFLPLSAGAKALLAAVFLLVSQIHLITRSFFGTLASPELPWGMLVVLAWLFGAFILLASVVFIRDVGALAWRSALGLVSLFSRVRSGVATVDWLWSGRLNGVLLITVLSLSAIGVWQAIRVPDVHTVEIRLPRLPAELDGLRVVQLSDLHASRLFPATWIQAVVDKTHDLNPDLILITGDLVDGSPELRALDVAPLRKLKARLGVFAIPGNHEYYANYLHWLSAFDDLGLRFLLNEHVVLHDRGQSLVVAGTTDRAAERIGAPMPDIQAALAGAPRDTAIILMAHQPRDAEKNADAGVDLQLSGHTHGGQVQGLHLITRYANDGRVSGLYRLGAMQLYVSNGSGLWSGFAIRLGRPSEITEIVLRRGH